VTQVSVEKGSAGSTSVSFPLPDHVDPADLVAELAAVLPERVDEEYLVVFSAPRLRSARRCASYWARACASCRTPARST
jgi:hypothetical protein